MIWLWLCVAAWSGVPEGNAKLDVGDLAGACVEYEQALEAPDAELAWRGMVIAAWKGEAVAAARVANPPPGAMGELVRGLQLWYRHMETPDAPELAEAQRHLEAAVAADDTLAVAHNALGAVRKARGDLIGAVPEIRRALALRPHWPVAQRNLEHAREEWLRALARPMMEDTEPPASLVKLFPFDAAFDRLLHALLYAGAGGDADTQRAALLVADGFSRITRSGCGRALAEVWAAIIGQNFTAPATALPRAEAALPGLAVCERGRGHQAWAMLHIGGMLFRSGDNEKALMYLQSSMLFFEAEGEEVGEAYALVAIGKVRFLQGDNEEAAHAFRHAVSLFEKFDDDVGKANALAELGAVFFRLGEFSNAVFTFKECIKLYDLVENEQGKAEALVELGTIWLLHGDNARAVQALTDAIQLYDGVEDNAGKANALMELGRVWTQLGSDGRAIQAFSDAILLYENVQSDLGKANALVQLGRVWHTQGDDVRAVQAFRDAISLYEWVEDDGGKAYALVDLGALWFFQGDSTGAVQAFTDVIQHFEAVEDDLGKAIAEGKLAEIAVFSGVLRSCADLRRMWPGPHSSNSPARHEHFKSRNAEPLKMQVRRSPVDRRHPGASLRGTMGHREGHPRAHSQRHPPP